jgi:hypothetical protein
MLRLIARLRPRIETSRRGQILVLFAAILTILLGFSAFVIDLSWVWINQLRVQRAADAAALAGVVYLPGDVTTARSQAFREAVRNGYTNGTAGTIVDPQQDESNSRQMVVTVTAPIDTFFLGLFGMDTLDISRTARAEFVLPVPMGSPENYYGVFGKVRTPSGGTTTITPGDTGWFGATATKGSGWTNAGGALGSDNFYATTSTRGARQAWGNFSFPIPAGATITGIEIGLEASAGSGTCQLRTDLSWNNGTSFTTGSGVKTLNITTSDPAFPYHIVGGTTDLWNRTWTAAQLTNGNFQVRVDARTSGCLHRIDNIVARVSYSVGVFVPDANLTSPYGDPLNPRGFWGTMASQQADDINGDAYLAQNEGGSNPNDEYDPSQYYNYAVEIPAGGSNGEVWIYDAPFCATDGSGEYGTGDRWFGGSGAITAVYELYDTHNQPYNMSAHTLVQSSGGLFVRQRASDATLNGPTGGGIADCSVGATGNQADGRYWHNRWYRLANNLPAGTYRVRTSSIDPSNPNDAGNSGDGHNSFSIWARASGSSPRVYGIGAMEAYSPLPGGAASTFYLAQIEAVHAGKTLHIELWDPGDTQSLSAALEILIPTTSGYQPANVTWTADEGTRNGSCRQRSGSGTSIISNTGGSSQFNGCWIAIDIPIPTNYSAPTPAGETEPGWWKIRYTMGGSSSSSAFDLTTWQVQIRGNPVHLVLP